MALRSFFLLIMLLLLFPLSACYHMRAEAVPIKSRVVEVKAGPADAMRRVRQLIEDEWKSRILEVDSSGAVLITAPHHFFTDTGFGMPAGGRKYYTQLRIEFLPRPGKTVIQIVPHNFEMRTSYAYNQDGRVGTLYKHYPYEYYPGMFDLSRIDNELARVEAMIRALFQQQ
ncbi:MAG: hypothetical protein A2X82_11555 [Geobacteraceae bacterium GWC2_55_20]|nr:MAG: hypothetical protein A2X82_11555 [Geobacteraceae bacterium GWC2_55_20]OGU21811.1 MAG: hypothetical protein A2X85_07275 [Geobacteraceae bacterium GWF2_54_21]